MFNWFCKNSVIFDSFFNRFSYIFNKMKISVVIHTYNAEEFLERVLLAVKDFDEVLICDMYSTDRTIKIAESYGCRIVYYENVGYVEPARMYAISQATNSWVLIVDADELVPEKLKYYLYHFIKDKGSDFSAIKIPRKNYQLGRFMSSYYPDYIIRFVKKDNVVWPPILHAKPTIEGLIHTIPAKRKELAFIHLANEPISLTIKKMNAYTDFEITRERRKMKKYGFINLLVEPFIRFLRLYIFKGGFKDGIPGFIWACEYAYYKFITIAKSIEAKIDIEDIDPELRN